MRWMTWRAMGQADTARHVVGCRSTQDTRVQHALDDVAGNICQALPAVFLPTPTVTRGQRRRGVHLDHRERRPPRQ